MMIGRVATLFCILFAIVVCPRLGFAQPLAVDWKYFGGAELDGTSGCFYDAKGVVKAGAGHIRVWTKCLLYKDMDNWDINTDSGRKIIESSGEKIGNYYIPPYADIETLDVDQIMSVIMYEGVANYGYIPPQSNIFYEFNCSERMMRELSIRVVVHGRSSSNDKPTDWRYVPPEGNGARLLRLLCPMK
jgi:hypothetical protein